MFVCLSVCPSVGKWRANGNPNPCINHDEILHAYPHVSKEGFSAGLTPSPPGTGGPKILKAEGHIFENCLQNKRCPAGCKLTRTALGTSAS